jgi:carbamoyl-phosphate synthase small subunit
MKGVLLLENGTCFGGEYLGQVKEISAEIIMNTAVVGYQEMLTDPANAGKILLLTYPLIGNYGIAKKFSESERCWPQALVIKENSRIYSNWQAEKPLKGFLAEEELPVLTNVDTRSLTSEIRDHGQMWAIISKETASKGLLKILQEKKKQAKIDLLDKISVKKATRIGTGTKNIKVAVLDLGMLRSFIKQLEAQGAEVILLPYNTPAEKILELKPNGLVISNGPEEDIAVSAIAKNIKSLIGKLPLLGIQTGHEIIALALGAKLSKLRVGHRGVNYPVVAENSYQGEITVQNHSWVVEEKSLSRVRNMKVTLRNLNDRSIEEMESADLKIISTQYYPLESGFDEIHAVFQRFYKMMKASEQKISPPLGGKTRGRVNPVKKHEVHYAKA